MLTYIIYLLLVAEIMVISVQAKTLSILSLIPITGREPSRGEACRVGMSIAVEVANAMPNVIPGYSINLVFADQKKASQGGIENFFKFYRPFFDGEHEKPPNGTIAPITLGPTVACQWIALVLKKLHFTEISEKCTGPLLRQRRRSGLLSNLFSLMGPTVNAAAGQMVVIKKLGIWNKVAVITYMTNINEYFHAQAFRKHSAEQGVEIEYFSGETGMNKDVVRKIKQSGTRIITLITVQVGVMCLPFLCLSHKAGMTAPQYVFVLNTFCFFDVHAKSLKLPQGCTREILKEQLKITIFVGPPLSSPFPFGETSLGYNKSWFESRFTSVLPEKPADYNWRHLCHDTALAAILILNRTEYYLRNSRNLTLGDFHQNHKEIGDVVQAFTRKLSLHGLRTGEVEYNEDAEIIHDEHFISQWQDDQFKLIYITKLGKQFQNDVFKVSNYELVQLDPSRSIIWQTKSGAVPKDLSNVIHRLILYPAEYSWLVRSFVIVQLLVISVSLWLIRPFKIAEPFTVILTTMSSILICIGAWLFTNEPSATNCKASLFGTSIGFVCLNSIIFTKSMALYKASRSVNVGRGSIKKSSQLATLRKWRQIRQFYIRAGIRNQSIRRKSGKQISIPFEININPKFVSNVTSAGVLIVAGVEVLVFVIFDQISPYVVISQTGTVKFDVDADSYYDEKNEYCHSDGLIYFYIAAYSLSLFQLGSSCVLTFVLRQINFSTQNDAANIKSLLLSASFGITAFGSIVLIALSMNSAHSRILVIAIGHLIYSMSIFLLLHWDHIKKKLPFNK